MTTAVETTWNGSLETLDNSVIEVTFDHLLAYLSASVRRVEVRRFAGGSSAMIRVDDGHHFDLIDNGGEVNVGLIDRSPTDPGPGLDSIPLRVRCAINPWDVVSAVFDSIDRQENGQRTRGGDAPFKVT